MRFTERPCNIYGVSLRHIEFSASAKAVPGPTVMLDHERGRPSEIDYINGAVPSEAARIGVTAPVNETLTVLVKVRERGFSRGRPPA